MAATAKPLHSCLSLCDPIDGSPPGSPVPGILQPRTLEWVAISFSSTWKWKVKVKSLSSVRLLATSWIAAYLGPLSMWFSRQEDWSWVPLPSSLRWLALSSHLIFPTLYCSPLAHHLTSSLITYWVSFLLLVFYPTWIWLLTFIILIQLLV